MTGCRPMSDLTRDFEAHAIDTGCFDHAGHVRVAYDLLGKYDFVDATMTYVRGIQAIATQAGVPDKFNLTITIAFLSLIAERLADHPQPDFPSFAAANPDVMSRDVLTRWYGADRLTSARARQVFLMPEPLSPTAG